MSITPQELQKLLDEREASRASRKRAWENLQEIRWVLKDIVGMELPPPKSRKNQNPPHAPRNQRNLLIRKHE
jgi:hypothetical protein